MDIDIPAGGYDGTVPFTVFLKERANLANDAYDGARAAASIGEYVMRQVEQIEKDRNYLINLMEAMTIIVMYPYIFEAEAEMIKEGRHGEILHGRMWSVMNSGKVTLDDGSVVPVFPAKVARNEGTRA